MSALQCCFSKTEAEASQIHPIKRKVSIMLVPIITSESSPTSLVQSSCPKAMEQRVGFNVPLVTFTLCGASPRVAAKQRGELALNSRPNSSLIGCSLRAGSRRVRDQGRMEGQLSAPLLRAAALDKLGGLQSEAMEGN